MQFVLLCNTVTSHLIRLQKARTRLLRPVMPGVEPFATRPGQNEEAAFRSSIHPYGPARAR